MARSVLSVSWRSCSSSSAHAAAGRGTDAVPTRQPLHEPAPTAQGAQRTRQITRQTTQQTTRRTTRQAAQRSVRRPRRAAQRHRAGVEADRRTRAGAGLHRPHVVVVVRYLLLLPPPAPKRNGRRGTKKGPQGVLKGPQGVLWGTLRYRTAGGATATKPRRAEVQAGEGAGARPGGPRGCRAE